MYDFWSAMWMLSSVVPRRIVVPRPYAPVHLNLYVMFISDSGTSRKSTAINTAFGALKSIAPDMQYVVAREGPEHLEHRFIQQSEYEESRVVICVSELMRLLGKQAYSSALPGLLTDLYDCPDSRTSGFISSGGQEYKNVYMTLLAGSTPAWLAKAVNPNVVEGGFTSRVFFIVTDRRKQLNPWHEGPLPSLRPSLHYLVDAVQLAKEVGQIRMTPNAIKFYKRWYRKLQKNTGTNAYTKSFSSRQQDHVLRVAALLSINSGECQISEPLLRWGVRLVSDVRSMGLIVFGGGHPQSRIEKAVIKIAEILLASGRVGVKRTDLTNKLRGKVTIQEFDDIMDLCIEAQIIVAAEVPHIKGKGRPAIYYFATDKLRDGKTREAIVDELTDES